MMSALLFCRLQRFEDVRRLSHRADVPLNQNSESAPADKSPSQLESVSWCCRPRSAGR